MKISFASLLERFLTSPDCRETPSAYQILKRGRSNLSENLGVKVFTRIFHYLDEYRFRLILACLCSAVIAGLTAAFAWFVRPFLDGIFVDGNQFLLLLLPIVLLSLTVVKVLAVLAQNYLMAYVSNWVVADIRYQLYLKLVRLPIKFHDANSSGRLVARVMNDAELMGNAIPSVIKNVIQQILTFLALAGVALYQDWKLAMVLVILSPIAFYVISHLGVGLRQLTTRSQELAEDMTFHLKETFSGIRLLKAYNQGDLEGERFLKTNDSYTRVKITTSQWSALLGPVLELIGIVGVAGIITYGGYQVINGESTPGAFYAFLAALFLAYAAIRKIGTANKLIQPSIAAGQRVFDLLDLGNEEILDSGPKTLLPISQSLEFRNVTFQYESSRKPALEGVSLNIRAGEVVAVVGSTGSGKTTLGNLLLRFYDPTEGGVFIDGENIKDVTLLSLRRQIAIVTQETLLFDDTVKHNIAYPHVHARDEDILEAARAAYALEFIERLPNGFDTIVGERGVKLSGGQRQRIAIARAILRNSPLLILDEATSSLDTESERIVQRALASLMKSRTTLVIAHRLSTIQNADRIVVLSRGHLAGVGTHLELLETCGAYQKLYPRGSKEPMVQSVTH